MIKFAMTYNGQPFSADRLVANLKREMMDAAEKELVAKAQRASAGKGKLEIKVDRDAAGTLKSITFSGDATAVEAAEKAIASG